jgi:hypothetical protein
MKKSILLSVLMLIPFLLMGQTIYYVNPSHPGASNSNPGTDLNLPWMDLNQNSWTDGCIVKVSAGVYTPSSSNLNNITIEGTNANDVIIEGMTDDEFNSGTVFTLRPFTVSSSYFATFKNVTIKNFRLDPEEASTNNDGGFCKVASGGLLNFEDVIVKNIKWQKFDGGAIFSQGSLNLSGSTFDNCVARKGGAIYAAADGSVILKNCKFINNNTIDDLVDEYKNGAAITVQTSTGNLSVDSCYFENNRVDAPKKNKVIAGGAIALGMGEGYNITAIIKNSTFNNNFNYSTGAAIATYQASAIKTTASFNLDIRNCTFLNNQSNQTSSGNTINLYGAADLKYEGKFTLVNNTFLNNNNGNSKMKGIFSNDHAIDFTFINNIFLDAPKAQPSDKAGVGNSIVINIQTDGTSKIKSVICRNNIIDKWGGTISSTLFPEWMSSETNNQTGKYNDEVLLNIFLTLPLSTSVSYLALQGGSIAIDAGLDSYVQNSIEMIPAKDIRGIPIKGAHKDVGAFEYDDTSVGIKN